MDDMTRSVPYILLATSTCMVFLCTHRQVTAIVSEVTERGLKILSLKMVQKENH